MNAHTIDKRKFLSLGVLLSMAMATAALAGSLIIEGEAAVPAPAPAAPEAAAAAPQPAPSLLPGMAGPSGSLAQTPVYIGTANDWVVRDGDGSLLTVVTAWANKAGWTFRMEHWTVPSDYAVQGGAKFEGDFKTAIRALLDTTSHSTLPVQPCFYTNKVLRVVPRTEFCDRAQLSANPSANDSAVAHSGKN